MELGGVPGLLFLGRSNPLAVKFERRDLLRPFYGSPTPYYCFPWKTGVGGFLGPFPGLFRAPTKLLLGVSCVGENPRAPLAGCVRGKQTRLGRACGFFDAFYSGRGEGLNGRESGRILATHSSLNLFRLAHVGSNSRALLLAIV